MPENDQWHASALGIGLDPKDLKSVNKRLDSKDVEWRTIYDTWSIREMQVEARKNKLEAISPLNVTKSSLFKERWREDINKCALLMKLVISLNKHLKCVMNK